MQLKDATEALDAYRSAVDWSGDVKELSAASGMVSLLQAAPKLVYPPTGDARLDIVATDSRAKAMAMLLDAELAAIKPQIDLAVDSHTLQKTEQLMPRLRRHLPDRDGHRGRDDQDLGRDAEAGREVSRGVRAELKQIADRTADLKKHAGQGLTIQLEDKVYDTHRGLATNEKAELNDRLTYMTGLKELMDDGHELAGDPKAKDSWAAASADLQAVIKETRDVVTHNWTKLEHGRNVFR